MVRISSGFWRERMDAMAGKGIAHQWKMCDETGRLENFANAARRKGDFVGRLYNDSDVYKLLEASVYALSEYGGGEIANRINEVVKLIELAQWEDGYINTAFTLKYKGQRYLALASAHELYCMGHLLEACSAASELGVVPRLVEVGKRIVDHLIKEFGLDGRPGYCGHEELELALARWSKTTGNSQAMDLSRRMTDVRGHQPSPLREQFDQAESVELLKNYHPLVFEGDQYVGEYCQDDMPLREQTKAVGHSVRAMYQFCGALDGYPDDPELILALEKIWDNMVSRRMFITGGIGSAHRNEGFSQDYDLPNYDAYCESCAGIGLAMWASRMAQATGDPEYMEVFERVVLNNVLSGISEDACAYHYVNPLASRGNHRREEWFDCACCPPNLARFVLSLGRYVVWEDGDAVVFGVPVEMEGELGDVEFAVESGWPWEGGAVIKGINRSGRKRVIRVRSWGGAQGWTEFQVNEGAFEVVIEGEYRVQWIRSHPAVVENVGRVALMHGPVVYCVEEVDLGFSAHQFAVNTMGPIAHLDNHRIHVSGRIRSGESGLYFPTWGELSPYPHTTDFVPYYQWNNRDAGSMQVWVAED
ncbi:MAG: glycoside hydrolase family 127 protein [Fimbriimonadaceae bacterium]